MAVIKLDKISSGKRRVASKEAAAAVETKRKEGEKKMQLGNFSFKWKTLQKNDSLLDSPKTLFFLFSF